MIYAILISLGYLVLTSLNENRQETPDGRRYISGNRLAMPFSLRWLLPSVLGTNRRAWDIVTLSSVFLIPVAFYYYLTITGFSETKSLIGCALVCGLNGVVLMNYVGKYLTDGFGMLCMILSMIGFQYGIIYGVLFSLIGSMANEKVFVYTALMSFNPYALIGGVAVLLRYVLYKHAESDYLGGDAIIKNPLKTGIELHKGFWFSFKRSVLVWGVCIIACMNIDIHLGVVLLVAYGSILLATDSTRLFMWAFPLVVIASLSIFPEQWAVPLIGIHWFNPYRINCI